MKYKFIEHTADIGIETEAKTLEEVFSNAALGLENVITDTSKVGDKIKRDIEVESEDLQSLLYDFLEKFLILFDSEGLLFSKIDVKSIKGKEGEYKLKAVLYGEKYKPDKHISKTHVKAITYYGMKVEKRKDKFYVKVIFDI